MFFRVGGCWRRTATGIDVVAACNHIDSLVHLSSGHAAGLVNAVPHLALKISARKNTQKVSELELAQL